MTTTRHTFGVVFTVALALLTAAMPAGAQEDGRVRTVALLPYFAERAEQANPTASFRGQDLAIEADAGNAPVTQSYLRFSLRTLPRESTIVALTLRLDVVTPGKVSQLVSVFPATFAWSPGDLRSLPPVLLSWNVRPQVSDRAVGYEKVPARAGRVDVELTPLAKEPWVDVSKGDVSLMLESPTPSMGFTYRGLCDARATQPCVTTNEQPRLIVRYAMRPAAAPIQWPQPGHDAQQSYQTAWAPSARVAEVTVRSVYSPNGFIVGAPAMLQNRLIVHTQRTDAGSAKSCVTAVDRRGRVIWDVAIPATAVTFPPLVGRDGHIDVVTESALVGISPDLDRQPARCGESGFVAPVAWSALLEPGATVTPGSGYLPPSVREAPTIGASGALYVSTDRGVFALEAGRRVSWRFGGAGAYAGPVALSPDETTAYVVIDAGAIKDDLRCVKEGAPRASAGGTLVAIDSVSGCELWRAGAFGKPGGDAPSPSPLVATSEDRTLVYVVDGPAQGKSLQVFDGRTGRSASLTTTGFFSRPVGSGAGSITLVRRDDGANGRLCRYTWPPLGGLLGLLGIRPPIEQVCQTDASDDLSPLSVLAADARGNVYAVDGTTDPQKVRGYDKDLRLMFALSVAATRSQAEKRMTNFGDNLLVGADGTLFTTSWNTLFAIGPKRLAYDAPKSLTLTQDDVQKVTRTSFLADEAITVSGNVAIGTAQSIVLRSGGGVVFRPGFRVHSGGQVVVDVGMGQPQ
jgi:hypothetical protein